MELKVEQDNCLGCGICVIACPVNAAISPENAGGNGAKTEEVAPEAPAEKKPAETKAAAKAAPKAEAAKKPVEKKAAPAPKAVPTKKAPAKKEEPAKKPAPKATDEITEDAVKGKGQFAIKRANDGRYMFNVHAGNTQVIASSQMYSTMKACRNGIDSVGVNAPIAAVEDQSLAVGGHGVFL